MFFKFRQYCDPPLTLGILFVHTILRESLDGRRALGVLLS